MNNPAKEKYKLFLLEDDPILGESLLDGLWDANFEVTWCQDGLQGLAQLQNNHDYHVLILDLGLPGLDGEVLLKTLRQYKNAIPTLVLTARGQLDSKIELLNAGADDYLAKPFNLAELIARLQALIRRTHKKTVSYIVWRDLRMTHDASMAWKAEQPLLSSAILLRLLHAFMTHPQQILSYQQLNDYLYGNAVEHDSNPLASHLSRLRKMLGDTYIENIRGEGWRLN